jgi:PiT family inorganic phosphate transporter
VTALLVALALGFAWSMGAHYTGACMGMPHALGAISARRALLLMAPLTLIGAAFASHEVERRVGHGLTDRSLSLGAQAVVVGVAFALTTLFNRLRIPTSTIQILVFSVAGVALAQDAGVRWDAIGSLAAVWATAPLAAAALGFALTRALDRALATRDTLSRGTDALGLVLVAVGAAASFAMGANDVSNASGALVGTGTFSPLAAGAVGGAGLAVGVLTWGRPLLHRVAFEIVDVDRPMATAAQLVQAAVVLAAVAFGYFTSMNQALVGAMAGAGLARGRETVHRATVAAILRGWVVGPALGLGAGWALGLLA